MIIFTDLEVRNYRNIKNAKLSGLRDINLFIGPNNCGKTNLLHAVMILSRLTKGSYLCPDCEKVRTKIEGSMAPYYGLDAREKLLGKKEVEIKFDFNEDAIDKMVPLVLERQKEAFTPDIRAHSKKELVLKEAEGALHGEHISLFAHKDILDELKRTIFFCPEQRLQTYKGTNIRDYIKKKNFRGSELNRLIKFIDDTVDSKIIDHIYTLDLVREIDNTSFDTPIEEQGSGVRSLICLFADILSEREKRIVLIDEPELGLNPSAKREFMRFLGEESKDKQIFLSTHDPTFVNPLLWEKGRFSVYLFSIAENKFVKINLDENKEDPNTFAGYLPHTTSLKDIHLYVEGSLNVYIYQAFLRRYLENRFEDWFKIINRIGVYHLGGSFWKHLLYTIPKTPYKSIIVLDGDKREEGRKVVEEYNKNRLENLPLLTFCESPEKIEKAVTRDTISVYFLKKERIEKYLEPEPKKKTEGPKTAEKMEEVPKEIEKIFNILIKW